MFSDQTGTAPGATNRCAHGRRVAGKRRAAGIADGKLRAGSAGDGRMRKPVIPNTACASFRAAQCVSGHLLTPHGFAKRPRICLQDIRMGMHISLGRPKYPGDAHP
jgi:hypothetical protein